MAEITVKILLCCRGRCNGKATRVSLLMDNIVWRLSPMRELLKRGAPKQAQQKENESL
jgi:hypothetical protein